VTPDQVTELAEVWSRERPARNDYRGELARAFLAQADRLARLEGPPKGATLGVEAIHRLRTLAKLATPGPWKAGQSHIFNPEISGNNEFEIRGVEHGYGGKLIAESLFRSPDCQYLAALAPEVIIPLLTIVEAALECSQAQLYSAKDDAHSLRRCDVAYQQLHTTVIAAFGAPTRIGTGEPGALIDAEFDEVDP
jgi:hypothetical protein